MTHLVYHKNIFKTLVTFKYTIQTLNCEADIYTSIYILLLNKVFEFQLTGDKYSFLSLNFDETQTNIISYHMYNFVVNLRK